MSQRGPWTWGVGLGLILATAAWWMIRRVWLAKEATEAEPPARALETRELVPEAPRSATARPDPVEEAIAESFPASDPPSSAGARGHGDVGI